MKKRLLSLGLGTIALSMICACSSNENVGVDNTIPVETTDTAEKEVETSETDMSNSNETDYSKESIKELYKDYFDIGICINPTTVSGPEYAETIVRNFSSVTCENDLKPEAILDKEASMEDLTDGGTHLVLDMSKAQSEIDFAVNNNLKMRGHTLVWHSQTPDWIFYENYDTSGELASRELMLTRLDNYMKDVFTWASQYPDLFYAWDVVNEAIGDDNKLRESLWYQTIGEDYVAQAFAAAKKYAPDDIKLFYNDYNAYQSEKMRAIVDLLTPIAEEGNIDGVGMQAHLYTGESPDHFVRIAKKYNEALGLTIHITEIDVPMPQGNDPERAQGIYYGNLFDALVQAKLDGLPVESVSVWGLTDEQSWKKNDKPLLFNNDLSPKNAYEEIIRVGHERSSN